VNVAPAADYDTDAILALDRRDFHAVRPLGRHQAFRVLPDYLPLGRGRSISKSRRLKGASVSIASAAHALTIRSPQG
jgi:hypothetical protein